MARKSSVTVVDTGSYSADADPARPPLSPKPAHEAGPAMLITILIILAIIALVVFIVGPMSDTELNVVLLAAIFAILAMNWALIIQSWLGRRSDRRRRA